MKKTSYVICICLFAATAGCIQAIKGSLTVEGAWIFRDASESTYTEQTLVFQNGVFSEILSENSTPIQQDDGMYIINISGNSVEIMLSGKEKRIYTGKIAPLGLMIETIDGVALDIPLFYKKG
ncbi:MAG: hypothetical protein ACRCY4_04055 [Brevinema sp.]